MKNSRNRLNVLTCLFLDVDDIFMEKNAYKIFSGFVCITSSAQIDTNWQKKLARFFKCLISLRIIATAQIGFLLLKALYLSFQMHTR